MLSCLLQECEEQGVPYERAKVWDVQADDAERWDAKKRKKKNPDQGFAGMCSSILLSSFQNGV